MKVISIIALVLGAFGLLIGLYCQLEIVPNFNSIDQITDKSDLDRQVWRMYHDQKFVYGSAAMGLGAIGLLSGLLCGIKKQKLGWIAVGISIIAFLLGAGQSTHMFS